MPEKLSIMTLLPAIFASTAFITAFAGGVWCKFLKFTSPYPSGGDITLHFGIWYYQSWSLIDSAVQGPVVLETCHEYPDDVYIGTEWKVARAFSIIGLILGGIVLFFNLLAGCMFPSKMLYKTGALVYLFCCFCTGMTLILLDSSACKSNVMVESLDNQFQNLDFPQHCALASGAKCTIAAVVFWFLAGLAGLKTAPVEKPTNEENGMDSDPNALSEPFL